MILIIQFTSSKVLHVIVKIPIIYITEMSVLLLIKKLNTLGTSSVKMLPNSLKSMDFMSFLRLEKILKKTFSVLNTFL